MATKKLNTQTSEMTSRIFGNFDKNIGRYKIRTTTAILLLSKEKNPELPLHTRPCRILKR